LTQRERSRIEIFAYALLLQLRRRFTTTREAFR